MRVLIADDHRLFRGSLRSLLEARGVEVVGETGDGRQAIELAHRLEPDVVLMDLSMPAMDGLTATRMLRSELPGVKVVVVTATRENGLRAKALAAGALGYLAKNFETDELFSLLARAERVPTLAAKPPGS
jgi:NarL family two-component system response regulator LiaR